MISSFVSLIVGLASITLLAFALLQWLHIPVGSSMDWLVASGIFFWLLVIVTVPWNIYFSAKKVLAEADVSKDKGIPVDQKKLSYVKVLQQRSLFIAIGLHLISAIALYALARSGFGTIGYVGSVTALLLTILRPSVSAYEYLSSRLAMIRQEIIYPREDIVELRNRFINLEDAVRRVEEQLNPESPYSWVSKQQQYWEETRKDLSRLSAIQEEMRATNQQDHERLSREAKQSIAQLTVDGEVVDHVREIIRFFKSA
jgi:hypothetical protein